LVEEKRYGNRLYSSHRTIPFIQAGLGPTEHLLTFRFGGQVISNKICHKTISSTWKQYNIASYTALSIRLYLACLYSTVGDHRCIWGARLEDRKSESQKRGGSEIQILKSGGGVGNPKYLHMQIRQNYGVFGWEFKKIQILASGQISREGRKSLRTDLGWADPVDPKVSYTALLLHLFLACFLFSTVYDHSSLLINKNFRSYGAFD
jgi:hypothetical protein